MRRSPCRLVACLAGTTLALACPACVVVDAETESAAASRAATDVAALPGSGVSASADAAWIRKLALIGLEPIDEDEAALPSDERGRFVPLRVIPGTRASPLPEDASGYLLVAAGPKRVEGAEALRRAIDAWRPGSFLELRVRRNPYLTSGSDWWESEVKVFLPDVR